MFTPTSSAAPETNLEVMLTAAGDQRLDALGPLAAWASASLDGPSIAASGPVTLLDDDGDGRVEAFASFSIAELRAAGLLGADTTRLAVRLTAGDVAVLGGQDRLFDGSAWVLRLPEPSGPSAVGTTPLLLEDESRGSGSPGRRIALRVWYPALASDAQPASYFLDEREARVNATNNGLPPDMFDRLHGASRLDAPVDDSERRPVLLMSTGWSAPIALYSGIAQELASHGYVVVGLAHPDGSGVVVYPDGTDSGFEPETTPSSDSWWRSSSRRSGNACTSIRCWSRSPPACFSATSPARGTRCIGTSRRPRCPSISSSSRRLARTCTSTCCSSWAAPPCCSWWCAASGCSPGPPSALAWLTRPRPCGATLASACCHRRGWRSPSSMLFAKTFPEFGAEAAALTLGVVALNELIAPALYRYALVRSGEAGRRVRPASSVIPATPPAE